MKNGRSFPPASIIDLEEQIILVDSIAPRTRWFMTERTGWKALLIPPFLAGVLTDTQARGGTWGGVGGGEQTIYITVMEDVNKRRRLITERGFIVDGIQAEDTHLF